MKTSTKKAAKSTTPKTYKAAKAPKAKAEKKIAKTGVVDIVGTAHMVAPYKAAKKIIKPSANDDVFLDMSTGKVVGSNGIELPPTAKETEKAARLGKLIGVGTAPASAPMPFSVIDSEDTPRGEYETVEEAKAAMAYDRIKVYTVYGDGGVIAYDMRNNAKEAAPVAAPAKPAKTTPAPAAPKAQKPSYRGLKAIDANGAKVAVDLYIDWEMVKDMCAAAAVSDSGEFRLGAMRAVVVS